MKIISHILLMLAAAAISTVTIVVMAQELLRTL